MMPNGPNRHSGDGNLGSEKINKSSEEELTGLSALISKQIEVLVIRAVEPILEPLIRRIVKEEIKLAQENILTRRTRNRGNEIHPSESRSLQLRFSNKISQPVMTGEQIKGEGFDFIEVALVDVLSGQVVTSGPLASAKVELVVLKGDFDADGQDWTVEEFNNNIVIDMEGKINGKTCVNLKEGVGVLDDISFKHSSRWKKSCELRLGARVVDNPNGIRVREAKTEHFTLKDRRNCLYKKHHPPALIDEVWRLEKIGKDGAFHKRLSREKVNTVKDFLTLLFLDPARLRNILGTGFSAIMWEVTVDHAKKCKLDGKLYFYCPPGSQEKTSVVFSAVGQLKGLLSECLYVPIDKLSETEKADAHTMVTSAFEHWGDVVCFDDDAHLMDDYSGLFKVLYPSISSKRASSDGDVILTSHKKTRFGYPSIYSIGGVSSSDDFGLHSIDSVDLRSDQTLSFPVCDTESISQTFCEDELLQYFDAIIALLSQILSWDSPTDLLHSALSSFISARYNAQRRLKMLPSVLKAPRRLRMLSFFLKRSSKRRIVSRRMHVSQVQRYC